MQLITLNIWGAKIHDPLIKFIKKYNNQTDFFTFQEVFKSDRNVLTPYKYTSNILNELKKILVDYDSFFSPVYHGRDEDIIVDYPLSHGNAVFWKKSLKPIKKNKIFVHLKENEIREFKDSTFPDRPVNFQYLIFDSFVIANLHGYWNPAPKNDVPQRIKQSEEIIKFFNKNKKPFIIAGDFNLRIDTKSIEMLEKAGLRNLVRESKAKTTRTTYYPIKWRKKDKIADYIFTSPDVDVFDFKVMKDNVSDHSPLKLRFDI